MQYASALVQYKCDEFGGFDISAVEKEIRRGNKLSCHICKASKGKKCKGACCGCAVKSCRKTFHFPCAVEDPESITKRLVVTRNRNSNKEKFVLYRVFCSKTHELMFRKTLKEELRGKKTSKRQDSDEDSSETDACQVSVGSCNTSAAAHNISQLEVASPSEKNADSEGFLFSPTCQTDDEHAESTDKDESGTITSAPLASKTKSSRQLKERRSSGFVRPKPQRVTRRVSQPPSCSMIEEMSNPGVQDSTGEAHSSQDTSPSSQQFEAEPETHRGAASTAPIVVHVLPNQESAENRSPNIPRLSPRNEQDLTKSMNECFVSIENGLLMPGKGVFKVSAASPGKESPSESHAKHVTFESDLRPLEGSPLKVSLASPAKSPQKGLVNGLHSHAVSPRKTPQHVDSGVSDSPVKAAVSPRRSDQLSARKSPGPASPYKSTVVVKPSPVKSPQAAVSPKENSETPEKRNSPSDGEAGTQSPSTGKGVKNGKKNTSPRTNRAGGDSSGDLSQGPMDTEDTETAAGDAGGLSSESNRRKRKATTTSAVVSPRKRVNRKAGDAGENQACVLLIPSDMETFSMVQDQVVWMTADRFKVKADSVCVWQKVTMQALPSHLLLLFMLDVVKELETDNGDALLDLLFDGSHLTSRMNNYLIQAQIFENLSDEKAQKDVQAAIFSGIENGVRNLDMVEALRLDEQDFTALAINAHLCNNSQKLLAFLQAYQGLFWWKEDTEVVTLPFSPGDQRVATATEVLTFQVWLTKVNPVTEVSIFPHDDFVLDKSKLDDCSDYLTLVHSLKESTQVAMAAQESAEAGEGSNALRTVVPLLAFQPVDFVVVNFQQYFRKVCHEFFRVRGLMKFLALMPLCNLYCSSYESISSLIGSEYGREDGYSLSVCSAFCPQSQPTTLVLLEISAHQSPPNAVIADPGQVISESSSKKIEEAATQKKRGRGRPKKDQKIQA